MILARAPHRWGDREVLLSISYSCGTWCSSSVGLVLGNYGDVEGWMCSCFALNLAKGMRECLQYVLPLL